MTFHIFTPLASPTVDIYLPLFPHLVLQAFCQFCIVSSRRINPSELGNVACVDPLSRVSPS